MNYRLYKESHREVHQFRFSPIPDTEKAALTSAALACPPSRGEEYFRAVKVSFAYSAYFRFQFSNVLMQKVVLLACFKKRHDLAAGLRPL
jgi:hypothetical protein